MAYEAEQTEPQEDKQEKAEILRFLDQLNIAEDLDKQELARIGRKVVEDYEIDKRSRNEWERTNKEAMDLAKLKSKHKTFPFDGSSNVVYPMITTAAIQFHARAYPNIVQGQNVVKSKTMGNDPQGAKSARGMRVTEFMNWQILCQMEEWEEDLDRALLVLPIVGCFFRKTYYSSLMDRNVSKVIYAEDLVVNNNAKSLEDASRVTELIEFRPNEYISEVRAGNFLNVELGEYTGGEGNPNDSDDDDTPHIFIEQCGWLDLDDDGYKEPYVITAHKATMQVVRITPRFNADSVEFNDKDEVVKIDADTYYTKFGFIPAPDGTFYDWGFGALLSPINRTVNTTINQLLDAGTLHNTGGGFISKGVKIKSKNQSGNRATFRVGEWKTVDVVGDDLRKGIVPLPTKEPSMVLFQLLGTMIEIGKDLSSVTDVLSGQSPGQNVPATTTLALIEQGMKVFTAIYKRIYRSLKKEFRKLYDLNNLYLNQEQYTAVLDNQDAVSVEDFEEDYDVYPVGDPNETSDMQKIFKSQALMQFREQGLDDNVIMQRSLEALGIPDIEELMPGGKVAPAQPPPEVIVKGQEFELKGRELELKARELDIAEAKLPFEKEKLRSEAIKNIADAESKEPGTQVAYYGEAITSLTAQVEFLTRALSSLTQGAQPQDGLDQGAVPGMDAQPGDIGGIRGAQGSEDGPITIPGGGPNAEPGFSGDDSPDYS